MYQALYRKYRPRKFSDVSGQEHVTETLRRQVTLGRLSHAYLFVGTRGTGKTTCAKILSRAINCHNPVDGDPCNECESCVGIESGGILDVLEIDAASNNGVDSVRALREEANYIPASVRKRVYIIDEVHMLSNQAFNALLKILEEPPEHLVFILATTELHKVPATILGRCQRFSFKRISPAAIAGRLNYVAATEGLNLSDDAADALSALADGSMRDALSLLDQCASDTFIDLQRVQGMIGLVVSQEILQLASAAAEKDTVAALEVFDRLYNDGRDMASLLNEMASIMRDMLVYKLSPDSGLLSGAFTAGELTSLSAKFPPERIFRCLDLIRESSASLARGGSARLSVEMCIIRMSSERMTTENEKIEVRSEEQEKREVKTVESAQRETNPSSPNPQPLVPAPQPRAPDTHPSSPNSPGWSDILKLIEGDISTYALIGNRDKVQADIDGGVITITTSNKFVASSIEAKSVSDTIIDAARKVLGRDVVLKVAASSGADNNDKEAKLDRLMTFGVVEME